MRKYHKLKIDYEFALAKICGRKPFEIRKNDRNFEVGDYVQYEVNCNNDVERQLIRYFEDLVFEIEYITNYAQVNNYVVFSEKLLVGLGSNVVLKMS